MAINSLCQRFVEQLVCAEQVSSMTFLRGPSSICCLNSGEAFVVVVQFVTALHILVFVGLLIAMSKIRPVRSERFRQSHLNCPL